MITCNFQRFKYAHPECLWVIGPASLPCSWSWYHDHEIMQIILCVIHISNTSFSRISTESGNKNLLSKRKFTCMILFVVHKNNQTSSLQVNNGYRKTRMGVAQLVMGCTVGTNNGYRKSSTCQPTRHCHHLNSTMILKNKQQFF